MQEPWFDPQYLRGPNHCPPIRSDFREMRCKAGASHKACVGIMVEGDSSWRSHREGGGRIRGLTVGCPIALRQWAW